MQTPNLLNLLSPYNIIIFMLVFTRLAGMIQTAPFFSTIQAPTMTKLWFAAITAFIMYPLVFASKNYIMPRGMAEFIILIAFEFLWFSPYSPSSPQNQKSCLLKTAWN